MSNWSRYIKNFVSYLKIEKGLAENSIFAYQNDVAKLHDFSVSIDKNAEQISYNDLKLFIAALYDLGLSARTHTWAHTRARTRKSKILDLRSGFGSDSVFGFRTWPCLRARVHGSIPWGPGGRPSGRPVRGVPRGI